VLEDFFSMMQFDCLIHPDASLSRLVAIVSAPLLEIRPFHWGEIRKNNKGEDLLDKKGNRIVDPYLIERIAKGKEICQQSLIPIESSILFE